MLDDCWGGSRTDDVLDDKDASLRYGSEHDESEKRLSIISLPISSSCPHFTKPSSFWKRTMIEDTWKLWHAASKLP